MHSSNKHLYLIFTDLKGYSKLSEEQTIEFQKVVCAELATQLGKFVEPDCHIAFNTWGDAVYAVFESGELAVDFAITYRDFFKGRKLGDRKLEPRIAGHFGPAHVFENPLNKGKTEVSGKHVNTTARMEPVTRPGEIFVTEAFKNAYESILTHLATNVSFEALGILKLAKDHDDEPVFRIKDENEKPLVLDKLIRADLSDVIPTMPDMTDEEQRLVKKLKTISSVDSFTVKLDKWERGNYGSLLLLELASKAKSLGLYERCLTLLEQADDVDMQVDGERVYAVRHLPEFKKIKANALTRLGKYKEAEDILFGLWHSGHKDADTLSMLAAQYKRRAIFGKSRTESIDNAMPENLNTDMLKRACKLYVEAFRKNIDEYYPAINAAYLYLLIDEEAGKGRNLARLILREWEVTDEKNWYLAVTLAEAEMLIEDPEDALLSFQQAVKDHEPTLFQLHSTLEQIKIYARLKCSNEYETIIQYLEEQAIRLSEQ